MALTKPFRETVVKRAKEDPDFRVGLLTEAAECFLNAGWVSANRIYLFAANQFHQCITAIATAMVIAWRRNCPGCAEYVY
jgi:hypothetical protein